MLGKKIVKINAFLYKVKKNYFINLIKRDKSNLPQLRLYKLIRIPWF